MEVNLHELNGNWSKGFALDKHTLNSVFTGNNENGYPTFDTTRSEAGEALYQLKYRGDFNLVNPLAQAIFDRIIPEIGNFGIVVPMPASKHRKRQPVFEIAEKVSQLSSTFFANKLLLKTAATPGSPEIKDLASKKDKVAALSERFEIDKSFISYDGKWGTLLIDDRYDSGASVEAACATLQTYDKVGQIFVGTCTW